MRESKSSNNKDDINNLKENEEEEQEINDDNENFEDSILFCHDRFCTSIPEIYFDENSSLVYLFCNKNEKNEKHKYCLNIKQYLKSNILLSENKLKKVEKNKNDLSEKIKQDIIDMKNKISYQKKHLEKITNDFNDLIHKIVDDFTFLLQNKLSSLIFQKQIINTYINFPNDLNANKNFQNLSNYMNSISISNFFLLEKCCQKETNNDNKEKEKTTKINLKNILQRISNLSDIFKYFSNTSHQLMTLNNNTLDRDITRINNMIVLKNGNLCFSSDLGQFAIYKLNKEIERYELISEITPIKNSSINYITQLSNELLVCCTKKLIIGELIDDDTKYNIYQKIDEFDNFGVVKVIELSNNYLATYDRGFEINIFMPIYNRDNNLNIEYQLIFKRINKGEQLCSLLALPLNDEKDVQYVSTSNYHKSTGKNCIKFYSSKKDYQNFDTIYDLSCSDFVNSLLMINEKVLAVGIRNSYAFEYSNSYGNGIALININLRQIITFIESEFPTAMNKLNNDLFVIASNKASDENEPLVPQKKLNFYYIDEVYGSKDCLIFISSINSGTKDFVYSIGECESLGKLIASGNVNVRAFQ